MHGVIVFPPHTYNSVMVFPPTYRVCTSIMACVNSVHPCPVCMELVKQQHFKCFESAVFCQAKLGMVLMFCMNRIHTFNITSHHAKHVSPILTEPLNHFQLYFDRTQPSQNI